MKSLVTWSATDRSVSSFIDEISYDKFRKQLIVEMKNRRYVYKDVPDLEALHLFAADSKGSYFNQNIKNTYEFEEKVG